MVSLLRCTNTECTVAETGICVLNNEPNECPFLSAAVDSDLEGDAASRTADPVSASGETMASFPSSLALGLEEARGLMGREQCRLVGLLGEPNSGKTACLVSLYLLLAGDRLEGFKYADSKSLMALDQLSRGARSWPGEMPEQLTSHTELGDDRTAGFLHFKIVRQCDAVRLNLLIPDLPGEWTTSLIDSGRTNRLGFLRSADAVWIMVDGQTLTSKFQRQGTIHRTSLLMSRLSTHLGSVLPDIRLVVSRRDLGEPSVQTLRELGRRATTYGIDLSVNRIASFSRTRETVGGEGIPDLVTQTAAADSNNDVFWPD